MVCLEANEDGRLNSNCEEFNKYNVKHIIKKHLWWWSNDINKWICHTCWSSLWSFHTFYLRVERAHNNLIRSMHFNGPAVLSSNEKSTELIHKVIDAEASLNEEPIPITKRKRGRPRLQTETIIEPLAVEVKNEDELMSSPQYEELALCVSEDDIKEFEEGYNSGGSIKMSSSEEEKVYIKPVRRAAGRKNVHRKGNTTVDVTSSVQLTKKYDDFIAQNHELFCSLCHVPLSDFQNLIVHFRDVHNAKAFAMCCGKKFFKRAVFVDHLHFHNDPEYFKCQHCQKVFSNRRCLKNHLDHHLDSKSKFICKECGKDFFRRGGLEKHKLLHVPQDERQHQCDQCDKKFASESLRTQHLKVTHLNKYAKICDICGKTFRERHSFQRHLAEHNGVPTPNISCDICGLKLTSVYGLNRHKRLRHTEENMREQICPYCSKISPNIAAHRSHIQYSHTMQRKHACHLCEKSFRRPKELKEHLSTHTGEALYTCPHCPRTFISNANMHKHRKNEHPKEWEEARIKRLHSSKMPIGGTS